MKIHLTILIILFSALSCPAIQFQFSAPQSREIASTNEFQQAAKKLVQFSEKCGLENDMNEFKSCANAFFNDSLSEKNKSKMSYFLFSNKSSAQLRKCNKKELDEVSITTASNYTLCFDSKENNTKGLIQMDEHLKISHIQNI